MEKYFALIKNNIVEGVIVADDTFNTTSLLCQYDSIIDVSEGHRPTTGDSYYLDTEVFISNTTEVNNIQVDMTAEHLKQGTQIGFEPFKLSKYDVTYEDGMVVIGCKKYSIAGLLDAAHKVLIEKHNTTSHFTVLDGGPAHGKFQITWEDTQKIYDVLSKVKL